MRNVVFHVTYYSGFFRKGNGVLPTLYCGTSLHTALPKRYNDAFANSKS